MFAAAVFVSMTAAGTVNGAVTVLPSSLFSTTARTSTHVTGPTITPATLSAILKDLRISSGLTWTEIGRLMGVDRRTLNNWVRGLAVSAPKAELIQQANAALRPLLVPGDPTASRSRILAPSLSTGVSPFSALVQQLNRNRRVKSDYSPIDLMMNTG